MDNPYTVPKKSRNEALVKDYLRGMVVLDITIKYHVTQARVYQILKKNKIQTNRRVYEDKSEAVPSLAQS